MSDIKSKKAGTTSTKKTSSLKSTKSPSRTKSAKEIAKKDSIKTTKKSSAKTSKISIKEKAKTNNELKEIKGINGVPTRKVKDDNDFYNDKKRAIILLLVATIIILILVISATYAYYSVQISSFGATHNVTTKLPKVGSVVLSNPPTNLHIRLNALNMLEEDAGDKLYATDSANDYESEYNPRIIALATVSGGEDYTKYNCSYDLNINITGTMKDYLQTGDAKLIFSGALNNEYDLVEMITPKKIEFNNLSGTNREEKLYAALVFNNKDENQDYLQGKNLSVELTGSRFACSQVVS